MKDSPCFSELMKRRRSTRHFKQEPLSADDALQLLRPALLAPSSKGRRAYEYILVEKAGQLQALSECKSSGSAFLRNAPLAIVVCGRMDLSDVWIEDASVAATTLLYSAEAVGVGACWIQVRERCQPDGEPAASIVKELLHLPSYAEPVAIIALGYPVEKSEPREIPLHWEKVHLNGWETPDVSTASAEWSDHI